MSSLFVPQSDTGVQYLGDNEESLAGMKIACAFQSRSQPREAYRNLALVFWPFLSSGLDSFPQNISELFNNFCS